MCHGRRPPCRRLPTPWRICWCAHCRSENRQISLTIVSPLFLQERTGRICQVDVPPIEENVTLCPQILEELQRVLLLALSEDMCVRPPFPLVKLFPGAKIPRLIVLFHCHAPWSQRLCLTMCMPLGIAARGMLASARRPLQRAKTTRRAPGRL